MELPIVIDGKEYMVTNYLEINGKNYLTYEDDNTVYINAYELENNTIKLLEITEAEKKEVMRKLGI